MASHVYSKASLLLIFSTLRCIPQVDIITWKALKDNGIARTITHRGCRAGTLKQRPISTVTGFGKYQPTFTKVFSQFITEFNYNVELNDAISYRNMQIQSNSSHRDQLRNVNNLTRIRPETKQPKQRVINRNCPNNRLKIAHLNIRSLRNPAHLIQLREFTASNKIDVVTISETWLNTTVTNAEVHIDGYKLHRLDRLHKRGGGVCAYIRKDIKVSQLKDISKISENNLHQLWLKLQHKRLKSIVICVAYRPPDCPTSCFEEFLKPNCITALTLNKPIAILGDLNCNMLTDCVEKRALTDFSSDLNLLQVIKSPTRITDTCQSLIDVILTSSPDLVYSSGVLDTHISDHLPVYMVLKLKLPKPPPSYITVRSYKNYIPTLFTTDLAAREDRLLSIFYQKDVNCKLSVFNDVLQSTLDAHAPIKSIKIRERPCPYITPEIKGLMKSRDQLHCHFLQTRNCNDWEQYKAARHDVKVELIKAERRHIHNEVHSHKDNIGSLWKIINNIVPSKVRETQAYSKDPKDIACDFNHFFSSVGRKAAEDATRLAATIDISMTTPSPIPSSCPDELFHLQPVTCAEVRRIILSMPSNKSPGPDKINMRVIKDCLQVILGPLTDIINCSLTTSTFPDAWKEAEIIPLLKDGDHEVASNNRPLSLLVIASKVCEKVVLVQFTSYLQRNGRLTSHQSGNRKLHSTETLNILMSDMILEAMDRKMMTALVLLDLSKAFDSISHSILLDKLLSLGASSNTVRWFSSYLTGRIQAVRIGQCVSSHLPITHGVPQGAILSPLLFCLYINDLPLSTQSCRLESYVDDSKVFLSFPIKDLDSAKTKLENDLHLVAKWCFSNQLLINPGKTKLLFIGTHQLSRRFPDDITISFLGKEIKPVTSAKDLGVIVDSHLSYDEHISSLVSSCTAKLCQINRVKDSLDTDTLKLMISALVLSKLFYCSSMWSNTSAKNISKLQSVQNFACRIITNTKKFDHVTPALKQLNWLPVHKHLVFKDSVMAFKCMNSLVPQYLCCRLSKRSTTHNLNTRGKDDLDIPPYKTAAGQRSFKYRATKIWNSLDFELKQIKSLNGFKKAIRENLLNV